MERSSLMNISRLPFLDKLLYLDSEYRSFSTFCVRNLSHIEAVTPFLLLGDLIFGYLKLMTHDYRTLSRERHRRPFYPPRLPLLHSLLLRDEGIPHIHYNIREITREKAYSKCHLRSHRHAHYQMESRTMLKPSANPYHVAALLISAMYWTLQDVLWPSNLPYGIGVSIICIIICGIANFFTVAALAELVAIFPKAGGVVGLLEVWPWGICLVFYVVYWNVLI